MKNTPKDLRPPYMRLADDLRGAIENGLFRPGDKLPSANELARHHGVSPVTAQAAFRQLKDEGLVEGRQGAGTFVSEPPAERSLMDSLADCIASGSRDFKFAGRLGVRDIQVLSAALYAEGYDL